MLLRQKYGMSVFRVFFTRGKDTFFDTCKLKKLLFYYVFYYTLLYCVYLVVKV